MVTITALCSSCSATARLTGAEVIVRTDTSGSLPAVLVTRRHAAGEVLRHPATAAAEPLAA